MKLFLKRALITASLILLLLIATPLVLIQSGPNALATDAKILLNAIAGYGIDSPRATEVGQSFTVAEGFRINLYAGDLGKIRLMTITAAGDLLVSRPRSGDILLLQRDSDGDGLPNGQRTLMEGLRKPHGLDIIDGWLYIAESTAVGKIRFDEDSGTVIGDYQRILQGLDDRGNHWTKSLALGPDGWLYLTTGSSCNACIEEDPQRATMLRFKTDGSGLEIFASGLRNSVGFDWAPWDNTLYATDNGRDMLGDDFPPCELNKIESGAFYGWPYINGFGELDPDLGAGKEALLTTAHSPAHGFAAHNAPLGMTFLRHSSQPSFEKSALVALHGSWNRSERDGYKVVSLHWQADGSIVENDFVTGFKTPEGDVIGRPVDVIESVDGSIYISDDYAGAIYRVVTINGDDEQTAAIIAHGTINPAKTTAYLREALSHYSEQQRLQLNHQGKTLFRQYRCGNCHQQGMAKAGQRIVPLESLSQRYSPQQLAAFFQAPTPPMPIFPLDEKQREALAVYLLGRELHGL